MSYPPVVPKPAGMPSLEDIAKAVLYGLSVPLRFIGASVVSAIRIVVGYIQLGLYWLAYHILRALAILSGLILKYVVRPVVVALARVTVYLLQMIRKFACGYLVFYPSLRLFYDLIKGDLLSGDKFDALKPVLAVVSSLVGIGFIAPECLDELGLRGFNIQPAPSVQVSVPQPPVAPSRLYYSGSVAYYLATRSVGTYTNSIYVGSASLGVASSDSPLESVKAPVVYSGEALFTLTSRDAPYYYY